MQAVLDKVVPKGPDEFCYVVAFDDGTEARVYATDLSKGCMVSFRCPTLALFQFAFEIMKAGNWAMLPAMESEVAVVCSLESVKGVPDDFPPIVVCNSADELQILVTKGVDAWKKRRDQIGGDDA